MTVHCANPACPEHDVPKTVDIELEAGEEVVCGGCGESCQP